MSLPPVLTSLTTREAVIDAVSRLVHSFDAHDVELFNSAFLPNDDEALFEENHSGQPAIKGVNEIRTHIFDHVAPMDTTHIQGTPRVQIADDAKSAKYFAVGMAQHCPPGRGKEPDGPKFLAGTRYSADLVPGEDGLWKIRRILIDVVWTQGDPSVLAFMDL